MALEGDWITNSINSFVCSTLFLDHLCAHNQRNFFLPRVTGNVRPSEWLNSPFSKQSSLTSSQTFYVYIIGDCMFQNANDSKYVSDTYATAFYYTLFSFHLFEFYLYPLHNTESLFNTRNLQPTHNAHTRVVPTAHQNSLVSFT